MVNSIVTHFSRFPRILVLFFVFIILGCSGPVKEKSISPETNKTIDRKTLVKKHRAFNHFSKAIIYENVGNLEKAAEEYSLALFYDPTSKELKLSLAEINFRLKRYDEALELLLSIEEPDIDDQIFIADCYNLIGDIDRAAEYFGRVIKAEPANEVSNNFLAIYYARQGDYSKAEHFYRKLVGNDESSGSWRLELASFFINIGKFKEAVRVYEEMIEDDSLDYEGYLGIASVFELETNIRAADSLYGFIARRNWDDPVILNFILQSFIRTNNFEMAINVNRRITELRPDDYFFKRRFALLLFSVGDRLTADSVLVELSKHVDNDPIVFYYRGRIAQLEEDYDQAESLYVKAIALNDTLTEVWLNLAITQNVQGDFEKSLSTFDSALVKCPRDTLRIYYVIGISFARDERFSKAIEYYLKFLAKEPENINVLFNLGSAYERTGQFENSEETFIKVLDLDQDHALSLNYLGYMYADKGIKLDKAEKMIKKALEIDPDNSAYLDSYAWVLYKKGKYKDALKYQEKAIEAGDDDALMYEHIGDIYYALNKASEAKYNWSKALELDPENEAVKKKLEH